MIPTPRPIEDGIVAQALVRFTGTRRGTVTYRGPSGREYHFSADPSNQVQYVLEEDLAHFVSLREFEVVADSRIDPALDARLRFKEEVVAELRQELLAASATQEKPLRARTKSPGRRPGRGFGDLLCCWLDCARLADRFGSVASAYDAVNKAVRANPARYPPSPDRVRYPNVRSDAKRRRDDGSLCVWHQHPEPWPPTD
jgi:hypothetical protein